MVILTICKSALFTLLISTTMSQLKTMKGNQKWYSLIFIMLLLIFDL